MALDDAFLGFLKNMPSREDAVGGLAQTDKASEATRAQNANRVRVQSQERNRATCSAEELEGFRQSMVDTSAVTGVTNETSTALSRLMVSVDSALVAAKAEEGKVDPCSLVTAMADAVGGCSVVFVEYRS